MLEVKNCNLGSGSVTYNNEVKSEPEKRQTVGNVTTVSGAIDGIPAHYQVSFFINAALKQNEIEFHNMFSLNCLVEEQSDHATYRSIEDRGARQLAPMLRSLADKIEAELPNFDEQAKAS
jgi:hypothetical protein